MTEGDHRAKDKVSSSNAASAASGRTRRRRGAAAAAATTNAVPPAGGDPTPQTQPPPQDQQQQQEPQQARPKSVLQWSALDVQKWLRRHCGDIFHLYAEKFLQQDITGEDSICKTLGVVF